MWFVDAFIMIGMGFAVVCLAIATVGVVVLALTSVIGLFTGSKKTTHVEVAPMRYSNDLEKMQDLDRQRRMMDRVMLDHEMRMRSFDNKD